MTARIKSELAVGVTPEIREAVEIACEFTGMKQSQFCRIALVEKLVRDNWLKHPGLVHLEKKKSALVNNQQEIPAV
jgi:hypothetical protein